MKKEGIYEIIRICGIFSFIPMILLAGPFGGYLLGDFLCKRLGLKPYVIFIAVAVGLLSSIFEIVRIIRSVFFRIPK